jgi:L-threonylcarbamoyladenylate synthase
MARSRASTPFCKKKNKMRRKLREMGSGPVFSTIRIQQAARVVRAGGVIAYPTEGVFGLGCNPGGYGAVRRILDLKKRPESAGLILIAACPEQLTGWIDPTKQESMRLNSKSAGAVTWVVTADGRAPSWITGGRKTIAVRITEHPVAAALCRYSNLALVSTSANRRGRPPAGNALLVRRRFGRDIDFVVPGPTGAQRGPTEIRNASTGEVLRPG